MVFHALLQEQFGSIMSKKEDGFARRLLNMYNHTSQCSHILVCHTALGESSSVNTNVVSLQKIVS